MSVRAIVGAQWGDEGKGKIVDLLAQDADVVVRFQGGANAGHTVVNSFGKFALHLIPCGIFNPKVTNIIGTGTVVDPAGLVAEIAQLHQAGISTEQLKISNRAHLSIPLYGYLDRLLELARGNAAQGSTLRGIAPAYAAKSLRVGLQMGSMLNKDRFMQSLRDTLISGNQLIEAVFKEKEIDINATLLEFEEYIRVLSPYICDTLPILHQAVKEGKNILLEGQLGVMRDRDCGM